MDLKDVLAISGFPGLYKMISQGKNALIVENLETGKRMPAHARHKISAMEDIAIFTETEDKPLKDFFRALYEKMQGKEVDPPKKMAGDDIKALFEEIIPDYDRDRVYVSDMKKALEWYNLLIRKGMIDTEPEQATDSGTESESETEKTKETDQ